MISAGTGKLLLYADDLAMVEPVTKVHFLRWELYQIKSVNSDDVTKAAVLLGNANKDQGAMQRWPLPIGNFFNGGPLNEVACYIFWY